MKVTVTIIPTDLVTKLTFISFLTFGRNQKQVLYFEQAGGLV